MGSLDISGQFTNYDMSGFPFKGKVCKNKNGFLKIIGVKQKYMEFPKHEKIESPYYRKLRRNTKIPKLWIP